MWKSSWRFGPSRTLGCCCMLGCHLTNTWPWSSVRERWDHNNTTQFPLFQSCFSVCSDTTTLFWESKTWKSVCVCRWLCQSTPAKVNSLPPSLLKNLSVTVAGTPSQVSSRRHLVSAPRCVCLLSVWDDEARCVVCLSPVVKKNNVLQLHVDAASEHSVGPKQSRSAGAKETVYLGGVPGEHTHTNTHTSVCIRCFLTGGTSIDTSHPLFFQTAVHLFTTVAHQVKTQQHFRRWECCCVL